MKKAILFLAILSLVLPNNVLGQDNNISEKEKNVLRKADSLRIIYNDLIASEDYVNAYPLILEEKKLRDSIERYNSDYAIVLADLAVCQNFIESPTEAISTISKALQIQQSIAGRQDSLYAVFLNDMARYLSYNQQYRISIDSSLSVLLIWQNLYGYNHKKCAETINDLGTAYHSLNEYQKAIDCYEKALTIHAVASGRNSEEYAGTLGNLSGALLDLGLLSSSRDTILEAIKILHSIGDTGLSLGYSLHQLSNIEKIRGDYSSSIFSEKKAIKIFNTILGEDNPYSHILYTQIADNYSALGDHYQALNLFKKSLEREKNIYGKNPFNYISILKDICNSYVEIEDFEGAYTSAMEAIDILEKAGITNNKYIDAVNLLGTIYATFGNTTKALSFFQRALYLNDSIYGEESLGKISLLNNLATNYLIQKKPLETKKYALLAINLSNKYNDTISMIDALGSLAYAYYEDSTLISLETQLRTLELIKNKHGLNSKKYADGLLLLGSSYHKIGNWDKAEKTYILAKNIYDNLGIIHNANYNLLISNLCNLYVLLKQYNKCNEYKIGQIQILKPQILKNFGAMAVSDRNYEWERQKVFFQPVYKYIYIHPTTAIINEGANCILFSKGLLLNTELELEKVIHQNADSITIQMYDTLKLYKLQIARLNEKPLQERFSLVDSLEQIADELERRLVSKSKEYGDFTQNIAIDWKKVQASLGKKDAAVEFVSFPMENDTLIYAAFVIRKGMETPKWAVLKKVIGGQKIIHDSVYDDKTLCKDIWGTLEPELKGIKNIYFSPAGELYNIGIEYLPDWRNEDKRIFDTWNLYRLSSTRELALRKEKSSIKKSAVYGGMRYEMDSNQMKRDDKRHPRNRSARDDYYSISDTLNLRTGASYLPGSRVEAVCIDSTLTNANITDILYIDTLGTEASFKALSGQRTNLLHLSTHGFYWTESEAEIHREMSFLHIYDDIDHHRYDEDKSLTRSGLLFSGANNALRGDTIPENIEDGILTAKEIAHLDLRGLDLVVLSACQTALGEITGEGVFGLQRGFKKAGAQSILMSLWKVDDRATQILMNEFYKNLTLGASKYESLRKAQEYLRNFEVVRHKRQKNTFKNVQRKNKSEQVIEVIRPYSSPRYWASFVLLDAVN